LVGLLVATAFLGAPATLGAGQAQGSPQRDPWSVLSFPGNGNNYFPPSCHQLSYFSGSPLRFDREGELAKWKPGSFTVDTDVNLLGAIQRHRIYQVVQYIQPRNAPAEGEEIEVIGMKRLLVERRPNEFCMIFEEQGPLGPSAWIVRIEPAEFTTIDGEHVLFTHDMLTGQAGDRIDVAWTFDRGVPVLLFSPPGTPILRALSQILPAGCLIQRGDPLDLETLTYSADVWKSDDNMSQPTCGHVILKLGIKNRRLVVVDKQYKP
jgi:hypothetical protein